MTQKDENYLLEKIKSLHNECEGVIRARPDQPHEWSQDEYFHYLISDRMLDYSPDNNHKFNLSTTKGESITNTGRGEIRKAASFSEEKQKIDNAYLGIFPNNTQHKVHKRNTKRNT